MTFIILLFIIFLKFAKEEKVFYFWMIASSTGSLERREACDISKY